MFVYQNKAGHICVTFTDNKPVETPEYVIAVDKETKKLFMVSGIIEAMPDQEESVVEKDEKIEVPSVEELDDVVENDPPVEKVVLEEAPEEDPEEKTE